MTAPDNTQLLAEFRALERQLAALRGRLGSGEQAPASLGDGECDVLLCRTAGESVGFVLDHIERVLPMAAVAPLPEAPPWLLGMLNLHGESLPVLDVSIRLSGTPREVQLSDLILVARRDATRVGLAIPEVIDVTRIDASTVTLGARDLPYARYLLGVLPIDDQQTYLLDVEQLAAMAETTVATVG